MSVVKNLVEVVLVVGDVERSMRFYNELLGLELISPPHMPAKFLRIGPPDDVHAGIPKKSTKTPSSGDVF